MSKRSHPQKILQDLHLHFPILLQKEKIIPRTFVAAFGIP